MTLALRACIVAACFAPSYIAAAQDNASRLLPASYANAVSVAFKQDGRVLDLKLVAPSGQWLATKMVLRVDFQRARIPESASNLAKKSASETTPPSVWGVVKPELWVTGVTGKSYETHVLTVDQCPNQTAPTHLELEKDDVVSTVTIVEVRGREQTRMDRAKCLLR